jgi:hypothetical protein
VERDNVAKELKFYIRVVDESNRCKKDNKLIEDNNKDHDGYAKDLDIDLSDLQRVFIHQSSLNFQNHHFRESNIMTFEYFFYIVTIIMIIITIIIIIIVFFAHISQATLCFMLRNK